MEFCPKCGSVLIQKTKNAGCPRCNYSAKGKLKIKTSEKINEGKEIAIIKKKEGEIHPIIEEECKKCKNNTFELIASEIGDKNNQIKLYCTRCKSQHYFYIDKNNFVTLLSF